MPHSGFQRCRLCQAVLRNVSLRTHRYLARVKPGPASIFVLELCVSDRHKQLLIEEPAFLPYLVDALQTSQPEHPRYNLTDEQKIWIETTHVPNPLNIPS